MRLFHAYNADNSILVSHERIGMSPKTGGLFGARLFSGIILTFMIY